MTDDDKALVERLRSRVSNREMLLVDPPRPAPDRDCHYAADRIEQLEAEVKTALHREAETTARYDAKIDALEAEIARKDAALSFAYSWLDRWATHIGMCQGGQVCMCGLTRLRFDITAALGGG